MTQFTSLLHDQQPFYVDCDAIYVIVHLPEDRKGDTEASIEAMPE